MWDNKSAVKKILDGRRPAYEAGALEVDGRELAAKAVIDAVHSKDASGLTTALANFHELHAAKRDEHDAPAGPKNDNDD